MHRISTRRLLLACIALVAALLAIESTALASASNCTGSGRGLCATVAS